MEGEGPQAELSGPEKRRRNGKASDMTEEKKGKTKEVLSVTVQRRTRGVVSIITCIASSRTLFNSL